MRPQRNTLSSKEFNETALQSLRRYNAYVQLIEAYQFVNCHPKMATVLIGVGVCLHLPSILYYSCYYLNYITNIYCTVLPNLMSLFNFKSVSMDNFKPPWYIFLFCALNLVTCYLGLVSVIMCVYLMLPIKGKYLATVEKQHDRRRHYCIVLSIILSLTIPYQIVLSLLRSIRFLQLQLEPHHMTLLSQKDLADWMQKQGRHSFWSLHAYQHMPCCLTNGDSAVLDQQLPAECCQSFGNSAAQTAACVNSTSRGIMWPSCVNVVLNIASDIEVTMDAQMQLFLLIFCLITFVMKYALHPHIRMLCNECQPTYGWVGMKRSDN